MATILSALVVITVAACVVTPVAGGSPTSPEAQRSVQADMMWADGMRSDPGHGRVA